MSVLVTSNRIRSPAVLAKIATTVDVVSNGRLNFGIGAGSRPDVPEARQEYDFHGLPCAEFGDSVEALDEALTVIRALWTGTEPFDFDGRHVQLTGAYGNPKPVQQPHPPILVGCRSSRTLRVAAGHADMNYPGADLTDAAQRSALLDRHCQALGRDPTTVARSIMVPVDYDRPAVSVDAIRAAQTEGFAHFVLGLPTPYPDHAVEWLASEIISSV